MIQYTTPTITSKVKGVDITSMHVWVTLKQGRIKLNKKNADLTMRTETVGTSTDTIITFTLTQEESGSFVFNKSASIQANWIDSHGVRGGTKMATIPVLQNLLNEVIAYDD